MTAPGWYGKLASLGDFASRRLSPAFIARWDGWLQQVIADSRARLGEGWLDAYLGCAVWRFVEWPEDDAMHAGLLMPSVDRVGRYFPLCIAAPMARWPAGDAELQALLDWLDHLDALALQTLHTGRSAQQFDAALLDLRLPDALAAPLTPEAVALVAALRGSRCSDSPPLARGEARVATIGELPLVAAADALRGTSVWWPGDRDARELPLIACRQLPDGERFTAMLRLRTSAPAGVDTP